VYIELVVVNSHGQFGKELLHRQRASRAGGPPMVVDHPPPNDAKRHDDAETEGNSHHTLLRG
jgi:hypothetical protein